MKIDLGSASHFNPDVSLTNENGLIAKCHRTVLTARSDFFSGLFNDHFDEHSDNPGVYLLRDISDVCLLSVASYVYNESIADDLGDDDFVELLQISDFYMLQGLKRVIAQSMAKILAVDNCLDWLAKGSFLSVQF